MYTLSLHTSITPFGSLPKVTSIKVSPRGLITCVARTAGSTPTARRRVALNMARQDNDLSPAPPRRGEGCSARRAAFPVSTRPSRAGMNHLRRRSFVGLAGFFSITMGANRTTGAFLRIIGGTDLFLSPSHRWTN